LFYLRNFWFFYGVKNIQKLPVKASNSIPACLLPDLLVLMPNSSVQPGLFLFTK
jgi:hypothetical protein